MPLTAPLASIALSVALAAPTPTPSPRSYDGASEVVVEVEVADAPATPEPEPAPESVAVETPPEDLPAADALADDALADDPLADDEGGDYADAYDPLRDSPEALRAASWVRSGVVFSVVGGLLTIGAIAMSLTDPCDLAAGNGCQETAKVRASLAMGLPGGLLVAGGAAMLAVGKVQQRRLRATLSADRRGFGAALIVRF